MALQQMYCKVLLTKSINQYDASRRTKLNIE